MKKAREPKLPRDPSPPENLGIPQVTRSSGVDHPSDCGASLPPIRKMAEERNPLEMTEEEIAEALAELRPERRAMSVGREVDPLPQSFDVDEIPTDLQEDPPPPS